jgi:hypothetical protein
MDNAGGLGINGSPTKEPSPAVQSLPSCLGETVAVIQDSNVDPVLPQPPAQLLARSFSLLGLPLLIGKRIFHSGGMALSEWGGPM